MTDPRIAVVRAGYETIPHAYLEWTTRILSDPKLDYLALLASHLPTEARVLELGCGAGEPCTRLLAEQFDVTGVDVSGAQLARARENVPGAQFIEADFTTVESPPAAFDAVAAFYCLNHVPRELLPTAFANIHSWLAPGGLFLASLGIGDEPAWTGEWLGTTMFFSSHPPETNRRLLDEAGFELVLDELASMVEPEPDGTATFQWVLCSR